MEIVVVTDAPVASLVRTALCESDQPLVVHTPGLLARLRAGSAVAAIVDAAFVTADTRALLCDCARLGFPWPAIQVLRLGEVRGQRSQDWAAHVLMPNECRRQLGTVLRQAVINWQLASSSAVARSRFEPTDLTLAILETVLRADPPVRSVPDLERLIGKKHTAIYDAWNTSMRPCCHLTLGEFIDWVLLVRAVGTKAPSWGWRAVARRVQASRHRLDAVADKRYGATADAVVRAGLSPVRRFVESVLAPAGLAACRE